MGKIRLRHRQFEGLVYGPDNATAIKFGPRGGNVPFEAFVDEDDPLVTRLLTEDPDVEIVRPDGPKQVYLCPDHSDLEFRTKNALLGHMKAKGHKAAAPAAAPVPEPDAEPDSEPDSEPPATDA